MFSNNGEKIIDGKSYCHLGDGLYITCGNGKDSGSNGTFAGNAPTYSASSLPVLSFTPPVQWNTPFSSGTSPISFANPLNIGMSVNRFSPVVTLPPILNLAHLFARKRQEELQQQAIMQHAEKVQRRQLDIAASAQYGVMDKLYIQGGLDAMRKEYYRLSAGTEGPHSIYVRAAYNALAAKEKEEVNKHASDYKKCKRIL